MKEIFLTLKEKNQLQQEMGCVRITLLLALRGGRNTTLIRLIRRRAEEIVREREMHINNEEL